MTLQELIHTVDPEQYSDSPLYQLLCKIKPEYGSNRHIQVRKMNGELAITNTHVGSIGDIITYPIDLDPKLNLSKAQILDAILQEMSSNGFTDADESDFWNEMTNLQNAKIVR